MKNLFFKKDTGGKGKKYYEHSADLGALDVVVFNKKLDIGEFFLSNLCVIEVFLQNNLDTQFFKNRMHKAKWK